MFKKTISYQQLAIGLIIILAAFLRFWQLSTNPPALNWDEVSHGYNAYSILKTGKDEWGQSFPLTSFRAFGDYKLPVYIYLTAPFVAFFGLNEWGVRLPSALFGVFAALGTFLLTKRLFNNFTLSAFSALLLAISPWHILISRGAFEANLAATLVIFAVYFFLAGFKKPKLLLLAGLFFGLSFYTYYAARVVVPVLLLGLIIIFWQEIKNLRNQLIVPAAIVLIFFVSIIPSSISAEGQARFYWTTILDQGAINQINEARTASNLPAVLNLAVNNKPIYLITHFIPNYLAHYSPEFLFFKGGSNFQYSIPGRGLLYIFELPLLIFGIFTLLKYKSKAGAVVLLWFLAGPLAASLTRDSPTVLRSILTLPSYQIISAYGFVRILEISSAKTQKMLIGVLILLVAFSTSFLLRDYLGDYKTHFSWAWQYGYKQLGQYLLANKNNYDRIVITKKYGEPHIFLLFYQRIDPSFYQRDPNLVRCQRSNWFWVDRFDSFEFVNDWEVVNLKKEQILPAACSQDAKKLEAKKMLLVTSPGNFPMSGNLIKTINFLDGKPAFDLVEF